MYFKVKLLSTLLQRSIIIISFIICPTVDAARFITNYPCTDVVKTCLSSGTRTIDGFPVYRDCWEYSYQKTCNYPSKNNCNGYAHCFFVALRDCVLKDSMGNCVNQLKEFSCKTWQPEIVKKEQLLTGLIEKAGRDRLICKGVLCIDGNCIDQSYLNNDEMMDSISKLYVISQMKGSDGLNFQLFTGYANHCSKKATEYTNCCSTSVKGWGEKLGAKCNNDEIDLINKRRKNLCVYVGKERNKTLGVTTVVKDHYCCFGNILDKVVQVEGRKQLRMNFGSPSNPSCRGLTLEELLKIDFNIIDFSEFFTEIVKRLKLPNLGDVNTRMEDSMPNIKQYDAGSSNKQNNKAGVSSGLEKQEGYESKGYYE